MGQTYHSICLHAALCFYIHSTYASVAFAGRCLTQPVLILRSVGGHQWGGPEVRSGGDRRDGSAQRYKSGNLQKPQVEGRVAHWTWRPASDSGQTLISLLFYWILFELNYFLSIFVYCPKTRRYLQIIKQIRAWYNFKMLWCLRCGQ